LPRVAAGVTDELHALLAAAEVPAPYLLVGHSLGGAYARRFAQRFPDEVCGMVLLDPFHEDLHRSAPQEAREKLAQMHSRELPAELTDGQLRQARGQTEPLFATWPDQIRQALIEHHVATAWKTGLLEDRNLYDEVANELRAGPGLPRVPLIVLTALGHDNTQAQLWSPDTLQKINEAKTALHAQLVSSVVHAEQRILNDAGHGWLHEQRQDDVLEAIRDVFSRVRVHPP
jgi:pimeloyl-ACP methyl ester carboxylesterase